MPSAKAPTSAAARPGQQRGAHEHEAAERGQEHHHRRKRRHRVPRTASMSRKYRGERGPTGSQHSLLEVEGNARQHHVQIVKRLETAPHRFLNV